MGLAELFQVLRARLWLVAVLAVAGGAGALLYAKQHEPHYQASATVLLYQEETAGMISTPVGLGGAQSISLPSLLGGGGAPQLDLLKAILQSRTVLQRVMDKMGLEKDERFLGHLPPGIKTTEGYMAILRKKTDVVGKAVEMNVSFMWPDHGLAEEVVNTMTAEALAFFKEGVSQNYRFAMQEYQRAREEAEHHLDALRQFEEQRNVPALDAQTQRELQQERELSLRLIQVEREMEELQSLADLSPDPAEAQTARAQVAVVREERAKLRHQLDQTRQFIAAIPGDKMRYLELKRNVEATQEALLTMQRKVEVLRLRMEQDLSRYTVLDEAYAPSWPLWPRTKALVVFGLTVGLLLGVVLATLMEQLPGMGVLPKRVPVQNPVGGSASTGDLLPGEG